MNLSIKGLTWPAQLAVLVGLGAAVLAAGELAPAPFPLSGARQLLVSDTNKARRQSRELANLNRFEQRHAQLASAISASRTQLALLRQALPQDKELDQFIFQLDHAAAAAGVSIRRITAQPMIPREDHYEMPFAVDLDGPYFGVAEFLHQLSLTPRIINVGDLKIDGLNHPAKYTTGPNATVEGTLTVITFFRGTPPPQPKTHRHGRRTVRRR